MLAAALTGLGQAPSITTQPQGQQVAAGANVTLSVAAIGAAPLSFQWLLNGFALSGKTNANLMLNAVRVTETGSYQVWVQNSRGTARSQIARLEVGNPLAFSLPIALTGWNEDVVLENAVTRSLTRDFDSSGASWFEAGLDDHADGLPASGTFASVANTNVVFRLEPYTNANVLRLSATNASGALILTAPGPYLIVSVLAASGNGRGFGALMLHFSDGSSSPAMGFDALDWFDQSPSLAIAGLGRDQFAGSELEYQSGGNGFGLFQTDIDLRALGLSDRTLTGITFLKPAGPSVTGIFAVSGVPNSVGAPIIIAQPQSRTVSKGSAVTFEVLASGASPLQYQWRFNRTNLSDDGNIIGSASARLTILSAQTNQNAYYSVAVSNSMGSATSQDAMLTVLGNPAAPGTKLWEVATGGPIASSPALATDGTIYIGSDDGKLWAINPDGTAKWRFPIGPQVKSSPGIGADGTIYVGSISPSNRLYAVDTNGIEKWEFAAGGPITTTPAIAADGTIYVTAQAGTLFALNADGTKRWEFPLGSQFPSSPALGTDGAVYVGSGHNDPELFYNLGEFYAIYPDGTRKWTFNARGPFASPAIGSNGIIYVGSFDNEGKLYAFDKQGHKLWEFRTGASIGNQPVIGLDGTIYFANLNQVFWAIAPDGTRRWTLPYLGAPAAGANGVFYFGSNDGNIYAVNGAGQTVWKLSTPLHNAAGSASAIAPNATLYLGWGNVLMAVKASGGLAESAWPMLQHDPRHTASIQTGVAVPTVIITNPVAGSSFLPGQSIDIEARAFGGAGGILSVDFYEGKNLLGRDTNGPYSIVWSNLVSGLHVLTALVKDTAGTTNLSGEINVLVNAPPLVNLTDPTNGAVFIARDNILLLAAISDVDGPVTAVEFFAGTNLLGTITNNPFALNWQNAPAGTHILTASATDNWGARSTSAPVNIVVNARPAVSIARPSDGTVINAGGSVVIEASASDSDGSVTRVDFFNGFNLLGSATNEPFRLTLNNVAAGDYTLLALAVDNRGATALSSPVTLTAVPANRSPIVSFDQPFEGAILVEPSSIQLVATANDTDGQLSLVEFFADDQLLVSTATSNTYSTTWSSPGLGNHLLSVKATDNLGATTSRQMRVSVVASNNVPPAPLIPADINRPTFWVPDGPVNALLETNGILYVGGAFNNIGQLVPGSAVVELSATTPDLSYPLLNGGVNFVIGDGEGGYYVGGLFKTIGDFARTNLAHVRADKTVDADFRADANSHVTSLALLGDRLFVGGEFTQIGGRSRRFLAAVDKRTGALQDWNPDPDLWVSALATADNTVYAGGNFRNLGGQPREYLAALDASSGLATPWNPITDDFVTQIVIAGDRIYAVGQFRRVNGLQRNGLAAVDRTTGATTSFNQFEDGGAREIAVVGNLVYVGGAFTRMGGVDRNNLAALDAQTSLATSWNPGPQGSVEAMAVLGDTLYVAGTFTQIAGQPRNRFAALNKDTGAPLPLDLNASGRIFSLTESAGKVFGGGPLGLIRLPRKGLAAIDAATGFATRWDPQCDGEVFALAAKQNTLYVGGAFSSLGGQSRNSLGAVDVNTGLATLWNPGFGGGIRTLAISGDTLFLGGLFSTSIGGQPRNYLAALDLLTGDVLPWNPNPNNSVRTVTIAGDLFYVAGSFTQIGGQPRNRVAALNLFTGKPMAWNPNANGDAVRIAVADNAVYVCGGFSRIGGQQRRSLAALDPQTGAATGWTSDAVGSVIALGVMGDLVYAGGQFTMIGGQPRLNLGAVDRRFSPPNAADWNPKPGTESSGVHVETLEATPSTIYVGGNFATVDGRASPYLAAFDLPTRAESPLRLPNGLFRVNLIGPLGRTYVFEASTNLTDWMPVFTNRAPFIFEDVEAINYPRRFYRALPLQ